MNYLNPVEYSKKLKALMEDESSNEEVVPVKGEATMQERISKLSPDDKKKLKEYIDAIKEIKKEIDELINKDAIDEVGGNMSSGLVMRTDEIDGDESIQPGVLDAIKNLAYSMPSHTAYDVTGIPSDEQIMKAIKKYEPAIYKFSTDEDKKKYVEIIKRILSKEE